MASNENKGGFATRWGLVLAAIGMAVGTGNIWRFPRMAAKMGGGSFIIGVVIAMILWGIPLLIAESVWGNKTRMGCAGSFKKYVGPGWTWAGNMVGMICAGIAFYYAVVLGWCVRYLVYGIQGVLASADSAQLWETFSAAKGAAAWSLNGAAPWHL
ncbi:MAG TPA: sodium-dependent transporter, partial [Synergistaceae bacterium]|nr:sodium-dependent transporter [Synergistaceae bacterium]